MADKRAKNGGPRKGAGRPRKPIFEDPEKDKITPVQWMLNEMRNASNPKGFRADMAKAAAPYCSAKLISKDLNVEGSLTIELVSYADSKNT